MLKNLFKLLTTRKPQTRLGLECQLMLHFSNRNSFLRKLFQRRIYYKYHCEISHSAIVSPNTKFVHPIAVVIGSRAVIGDNVTIYQGVTIGSNLDSNNEMPIIGNNCIICAGAKVIGGITIGDNVTIGANSLVTKDVPSNTVVVGVNKILDDPD